MGNAFQPCNCPFIYRRVYAFGGSFGDAAHGLYINGDKTSFVACYLAAIAAVNAVDINTVPFGSVRFLDYGGYTADKNDCTFVDHGNLINNPTNLPGNSTGTPPCGTGDFGSIVDDAGTDYSYMGLNNSIDGINPGGYQQAIWYGPGVAGSVHGVFAVSRIQVSLAAQNCSKKWCVCYWDNNSSPVPGYYTIQGQCDATNPSDCAACENGSTVGAICVDIPPITWFYQFDPDLPISAQYFVPGYNIADLT